LERGPAVSLAWTLLKPEEKEEYIKAFEFDAAKWTAEMQNRDILESGAPNTAKRGSRGSDLASRKSSGSAATFTVGWVVKPVIPSTVYGAREHFAPGMHREKEAGYKTQWFIDLASLTELRDPSDPDCAICKSPFVMPPVNAT